MHALVGENGAGKSTIINLLSGRLLPDAGQIELNGAPAEFRNPLAARRAGISVIAQELEVVPTLTIVENVFLGSEPTKFGLVRWGDARRTVVGVLKELGVHADPDRVVGSMSVADQQLVEIAKAVVGQFRVLIMDEPTSALNLEDTERLFKIVRRLKADGVAILYVSHRLWEVFDLADRVTVLRDGNRIFTTEIARTDVGTVIRAMLGSKSSLIAAADHTHRPAATPTRAGTPALELDAVGSGELLRDISLSVHPGEVIGLAGVLGSGRTELAEAIYGLRRIDAGTVRLNGVATSLREPKEALRHGVFLLPEDRKSEGIFGHLDVRENVILGYNPAAEASQEIEPVGVALAAPEPAAPRRRIGLRADPGAGRAPRVQRHAGLARHPLLRAGRPDHLAQRRQPAEGAVRARGAVASGGAVPVRADPRRRCRRQGRNLFGDRRVRQTRHRDRGQFLGDQRTDAARLAHLRAAERPHRRAGGPGREPAKRTF